MLYNTLSVGKTTPKFPLPLGFRHPAEGGPSHGHRKHPQKIGKDRACGSGDILAVSQTHTTPHTHRRSHHNTSQPLPQVK